MSEAKKEPNTSQSGTISGYRVEAMNDYREPLKFGDQIFTRDWREVAFIEGHGGVPVGHRFESPWLVSTHCYSLAAAEALRWWFISAVQADPNVFSAWCLRTRIVQYDIVYSVAATRGKEILETNAERRVPSVLSSASGEPK